MNAGSDTQTSSTMRWSNPTLDELMQNAQWSPTIDEALANGRVRNSAGADAAFAKKASTDTERIQRQIDAYAQMNDGTTARRRFGFIVRSVNLYRFLAKQPLLNDVKRP